jgi:hypothetical protein
MPISPNKQKLGNRQGVDWERSGNGPNRIPIAYRIFSFTPKPTGSVPIKSRNRSENNTTFQGIKRPISAGSGQGTAQIAYRLHTGFFGFTPKPTGLVPIES